MLCRAWQRSDKAKESLCQLKSPDLSLTALALSLMWLKLFFSHLTGIGDRIPVLCEAAAGSHCLTSLSLHPLPYHTHPSFTEDGRKPHIWRCGKKLQAAWWFRVSRQVAGPHSLLSSGEKQRRGCSVGSPRDPGGQVHKLLSVSTGVKKLPGLGHSPDHRCSG